MLALLVAVASLITIPGATPAHAADITYVFVFADGGTGSISGSGDDSGDSRDSLPVATPSSDYRTITGTATSNDVDVVVDGVAMKIKMNCDDLFDLYPSEFSTPGDVLDRDGSNGDWGWGQNKDPDEGESDHFRVFDFFLFDADDNIFCGNTDLAPAGLDLPVVYGPGQYQFRFVFATSDDPDGTTPPTPNGPGIVITGSSEDNVPMVTLPMELCGVGATEDCTIEMHVSCSDNFNLYEDDDVTPKLRDGTNSSWGVGEKDGPQPPVRRLWDYYIFKLGDDKECGTPPAPAIDIEKTPDTQIVAYDTTATFSINVTNTGNTTLTDVTVTDANAPDCNASIGTLAAGESFSEYLCEVDNVTAGFLNTAVVTGDHGAVQVTDQDDADVDVARIDITKTAVTPIVEWDDTATFSIVVTNNGEVDLADTAVADALAPLCAVDATTVEGLTSSLGGTVGDTLTPGESFNYQCSLANVQLGLTNSATATANADGPVPVDDTDTADVDVARIDITKTAVTPLPIIDGGFVFFTITVQNTGEVPLFGVWVQDDLLGECERFMAEVEVLKNKGGNDVGSVLSVGETFSYGCFDEINESLTNVAIAHGESADGVDVSDSDDAPVTVVHPDITIEKTPDTQILPLDGLVYFTIQVTNTGDVALTGTWVQDDLVAGCAKSTGQVEALKNKGGNDVGTVLSVGENFTYECFDERQTAFTNSATARALWNATPVEDSNIADVTVGSPYAAAVLGDGAVAYWRFGEASGSTAEDASGTLDATYVGPPTLGAAGLIDDTDTAADFDGTTDSVVVPNDALINTAGPYTARTVELWFHADAVTGRQVLWEEGGSSRGINIYIEGGQLHLGGWNLINDGAGTPWGPVWVSGAVSAGTTYHAVLVFDGTGGRIEGFLDGVSMGSITTGVGPLHTHAGANGIGATNSNTRFPAGLSSAADRFAGTIDEVAIYNSALTGGQIAAHYTAGT